MSSLNDASRDQTPRTLVPETSDDVTTDYATNGQRLPDLRDATVLDPIVVDTGGEPHKPLSRGDGPAGLEDIGPDIVRGARGSFRVGIDPAYRN